jgi:putative ABC transport system permease protein
MMAIDWRGYVRARLKRLHTSPEREIEIVEELASQLEATHARAIARGLSEEQARQLAAAEVPDWNALARTLARIESPARPKPAPGSGSGIMTGFVQDIRYALRGLAGAPGFAAGAITTLALGIGATTIIYSLVDGILLRPLPIRDPDRVVLAREINPRGTQMGVSYPNFQDWRARAQSYESLAGWFGRPANLTGLGQPRRIMIRQVTWNLFDTLGVRPAVGRGFVEADDRQGAPRVCLVSHGFWQREMGGRESALGATITLDDSPVTVVGVLPPDFTVARQEDAFITIAAWLQPNDSLLARGNHGGLAAIGRLKDGVTVESAAAELSAIAAQLAQEYPATNSGNGAIAIPLFEVLVSASRPMLLVLLGAVAAMLSIACVNLANLLLARGSARAHEIAVRHALGAKRWRVVRQLLTESVILGLSGGVAGIALAWAGLGSVLALLPSDQARLHLVALDERVLVVALLVSMLTGVLFGLAPAFQAATGRSLSLLRTTRVSSGAAHGSSTTRRALLMAEVSLALVLLVGAGLMLRTMTNLMSVDLGFDAEHVVSAQFGLPAQRYPVEQRRLFYDSARERLLAVPGVQDAAFTLSLPVQGSNWNSIFIVEGQPVPERANLPSSAWTPVSPSYFDVMGIRVLRGRGFLDADGPDAARVAVINETFARRFWPDGDPIGQRIKQGWPEDKTPWREIVGVVRDVKTGGVDQPAALQAYLPLAHEPSRFLTVVARVEGDPALLARSVEAALQQVDPSLPVYEIRTMDAVIDRSVGQQRLTMTLLLGFAVLALLMAAVGVFGVTAYTVAQRTHELGLRMALGADRFAVMRLVMREELGACLIGVALGLGGAIALSSLLEGLLFSVAPRDPATLAAVSVLLLAVTGLAAYLPALRATRIDPISALRAE